ncbi:MAG TPA: hypothetical protein VGY76_01830 [Solirubrobacteraceae bacterium]|nr:hypothetical protein [Solirubrobacteraceae bacterium]
MSDTGVSRLAGVVFAALVLASFAAFAITQHLKHTPTVVQNFHMTGHFSPRVPGRHALEHISFRIAHSDDVTVAIEDSSGNVVATLVQDRPLARYTQLSLVWDGHRGPTSLPTGTGTPHNPLMAKDRGRLADAGEYRVRVSLRVQHRTVRSPRTFVLQ